MMDKIALAIKQTFTTLDRAVDENTRLGEIKNWDSMNSVTLVIELESAFGVDLSDVNLTENQTVADIVALLRERGVGG